MNTTNGTLAVRLLRLTNIGGIEGTLEIPLGEITYLEGTNGVGKSSVVDGVAALCGASVEDLLNQDAEEGEVYLELTDGTWFRRAIDADGGNRLTAGHPEQGPIGRAAGWLKATLSAAALSPEEFLTADDEKASEYILRAAPLTVSPQEIAEAVGSDVEAPDVDTEGHALTVLDQAIKVLYAQRRDENAVAREARATIDQLSRSLPEDPPDPKALAEKVALLEEKAEELMEEAATAKTEAAKAAREDADRELAALDEAIEAHDEEVARLEAELAMAKAARKADQEKRAAAVELRDQAIERAQNEAAAPYRERYATVEAELKAAREALQAADRAEAAVENTREMIESQTHKAQVAEVRSKKLTEAMARLEALKTEKARDLPVEGISIQDGRLHIGGVPAHRANEAARVRVALDASTAQDTRIRFVFADRLESLATRTREEVERACRERGIQILGARVTDDEELVVRTAEAGYTGPHLEF